MQLFYNWNQQLINQQNNAILIEIYTKQLHNKSIELFDISSLHENLCYQSTYFTKISDEFENYLVQKFDLLVKKVKKQQQQGIMCDYSQFINISEIIQHLDFSKIKNYKNFHNFLNILKSAVGQIEIRIGIESNYYEAPPEFTTEKIRILNRQDENIFNQSLDKAGQQYKQFIEEKTKKEITLAQKYQEIKQQLINIPSWRSNFYIQQIFYRQNKI